MVKSEALSAAGEITLLGEPAVLRRLLGLLMQPEQLPGPADILDAASQPGARSAFFLLDCDEQGDVERFVLHTLRRLFQHLSHLTMQRQVERQGRIRGRVVWPATYKARYAQDYDPSRFVCREVQHKYDTPENQLLKFLVERIRECLQAVPPVLRSGACYFPAGKSECPKENAQRLMNIESAISHYRRNIHWRKITLVDRLSDLHLARAEAARIEEYAAALDLYQRYQQIVLSSSWAEIVRIGKRNLPLPASAGQEQDVWIRFGAAILLSP